MFLIDDGEIMWTRYLVSVLLLFCISSECALAEEPLAWGSDGGHFKWRASRYAVAPNLSDFPILIKAARDPSQPRRYMIMSQLRAISRCNFGSDGTVSDANALASWEKWWLHHGVKYQQDLALIGRSYTNSWKKLPKNRDELSMAYALVLPQSWTCSLSFKSGDYFNSTEENLDFEITPTTAKLNRRYRRGLDDWICEEWAGFTRSEADEFLAALIYAIDNPWIYATDVFSETNEDAAKVNMRYVRGRPEVWCYYPSVKWTGIVLSGGEILINDDPNDYWEFPTEDAPLCERHALDDGIGVVFRVVRDVFPDPSLDNSKWSRVESGNRD